MLFQKEKKLLLFFPKEKRNHIENELYNEGVSALNQRIA